jgi:sugar-phosphatase
MVTAEDVKIGKPNPQGYILGAERLGVSPTEVLVFEDVLAGVQAGEAAGSEVMVITATHTHPLKAGHYKVPGYLDVIPHIGHDGRISIRRK